MRNALAVVLLGIYVVSIGFFSTNMWENGFEAGIFGKEKGIDAQDLGVFCLSEAYPTIELALKGQEGDSQNNEAEQNKEDFSKENQDITLTVSKKTTKGTKNFGKDPLVLILHTHATESYLPSSQGNFHKKDKENTVRDVGDVLTKTLENRGIVVVHDETLHDSPSYNNSYNRSYETTSKVLEKYPTIQCIIDLHRDAVASQQPAATVSILGNSCAKYSYVVSTEVETYENNLEFIHKMNQTAKQNYNGFTGNILERGYRYNQGLSSKYMLLEIGYNRNEISDCRETAKIIGEILADTLGETLEQ